MKATTGIASAIIAAALVMLFVVPIGSTTAIGGIAGYTTIVITLIVGAVCGVVTQRVMVPKGYGEASSFCIGLFLSLVGVVIACVLPPKEGLAQTSGSEVDKARALREYKELFDDGTITREEFEAKKRELLG